MTDLLNNLKTELIAIGLVIAVIGMVALGCIVIVKSLKGSGGLREALSGLGGIAFGIILIGGGTALVGAVMSLARSL